MKYIFYTTALFMGLSAGFLMEKLNTTVAAGNGTTIIKEKTAQEFVVSSEFTVLPLQYQSASEPASIQQAGAAGCGI